MDVGAGTGRLMCMLPILFGSPVIVLGLENTDNIFSHGAGTITQARTISETKVNCFCHESCGFGSYEMFFFFFSSVDRNGRFALEIDPRGW